MGVAAFDHVDLVVSSLERSLRFYRELLGPLGWTSASDIVGERGERVVYIQAPAPGSPALGMRERRSDTPLDRYGLGLHHVCLRVASRAVVDERARWLAASGAEIESPPREYDYSPGYYAVFFHDPDGIKLELRHRPV